VISTNHAQQERLVVLECERFIRKLFPVYRLAARPVAVGNVSTLDHELLDHSVKDAAFEVECFPRLQEVTPKHGSITAVGIESK
jgi:hypothetical protein